MIKWSVALIILVAIILLASYKSYENFVLVAGSLSATGSNCSSCRRPLSMDIGGSFTPPCKQCLLQATASNKLQLQCQCPDASGAFKPSQAEVKPNFSFQNGVLQQA
jgi:hypothetical protein